MTNDFTWWLIAALLFIALSACGGHVDAPPRPESGGSAAIQHAGGPMVLLSSTWADSKGRGGCRGDGC